MEHRKKTFEPRLCVVGGQVCPITESNRRVYVRITCGPRCVKKRAQSAGCREKVLELLRAGRNKMQIARELGITRQRVYQILKGD